MSHSNAGDDHDRWARLRFAVIGPLLASPPPRGRLRTELERLSQRDWAHPSGRGPVRFSVSPAPDQPPGTRTTKKKIKTRRRWISMRTRRRRHRRR